MCFSSRSVHVQVCVSLGLGVTGGRYAMSWLTRVLLCCSVLHDWPSAVRGHPPSPLTPEHASHACLHTHNTHTFSGTQKQIHGHTQSCAHKQILLFISWWPVIELGHHQWYFRFGGPMHPSEEASALFFPATELFNTAASMRHGLRGSHAHYPSPAAHIASLSHSHTAPRGTCSSVTLPNNNTPSTAWLFTFWKR